MLSLTNYTTEFKKGLKVYLFNNLLKLGKTEPKTKNLLVKF